MRHAERASLLVPGAPPDSRAAASGDILVEGMAYLAKRITQASELVIKFNQLEHVVIPGVVKWRYSFDNDWSGDPAIFFWVTLTDQASKPQHLGQAKAAFIATINNHVDLAGERGYIPYFNFRSVSEQAKLRDDVYE
jgi:hypothetical protein